MAKLKFEMWPYISGPNAEQDGYMSRFTDGKGRYTDSWWSSPCQSIDHVGMDYMPLRHRHPNCRNENHLAFIKRRYKEEMSKLRAKATEPTEILSEAEAVSILKLIYSIKFFVLGKIQEMIMQVAEG